MKDIIEKYQFKGNLSLEFEILDLSERLQSKGAMMTIPHRAQFYHILWIEKGQGIHYVDFKPINIEDQTLIFVPSNSVNSYDANLSYEGKAIIFTDKFFCKNNEDLQYLRGSPLFSDLYDLAKIKVNQESSDLMSLIDAMQTEFDREVDPSQYSILRNLVHIFLLKSEREMHTQGFVKLPASIHLDQLIFFKELLEQNFHQYKSVQKYASDLNISEKQLHKACKTLLDKTPKQIIDERVLLEAKRSLAHSTQSIKEIAYDLGYVEPTNFIKYFRKHTHTTPSEFRELY